MKVKPIENFKLLGTDIQLNKKKKYRGIPACNIPEYKENGLIFVKGVLLNKTEYIVL